MEDDVEKKVLVPFLFICLAFLSGASSWEGVAEVGTASMFVKDGLYAASSVFPEGRQVDVTVLSSGKTQRVLIVTDLSPGTSEHFLLLAPQAVAALDLKTGGELRVSAGLVDAGFTAPGYAGGMAETSDPDYNMKLLAIREKNGDWVESGKDAGSGFVPPLAGGVFLVEKSGRLASAGPTPASAAPGNPQTAAAKTSIGSSSFVAPPPLQADMYLQVGAFSTANAMSAVMRRFSPFFPMDVRLSTYRGKPLYRLLVGPLSSSDMATAKARARASGIGDAFVTDGK